jgi:hypothetical protein
VQFPVEAGHVMTFARAVGDPNPIYSDSEYAQTTEVGAVITPPTFFRAIAQFDPLSTQRPTIGQRWRGSGRLASGTFGDEGLTPSGTTLHAEQHYTYHRLVEVGDVLTSTEHRGESWERAGRRGGVLAFSEVIIEFRNQDNNLVVTSRHVSVRTSQVVER